MIKSRSWQIFFYKRSGNRQRGSVDTMHALHTVTTTEKCCSSTKVVPDNMQVANI